MHHMIKVGEAFQMLGRGPSYEDFQRMARRLTKDDESFVNVSHRFHFVVDKEEVLVLWFCTHRLYQKKMSITAAESLFGTLERSGFRVNRLN